MSNRKAKSSSRLMSLRFFFAQATMSLVFFLCPYLTPHSMHCLHTSADPMRQCFDTCNVHHKYFHYFYIPRNIMPIKNITIIIIGIIHCLPHGPNFSVC